MRRLPVAAMAASILLASTLTACAPSADPTGPPASAPTTTDAEPGPDASPATPSPTASGESVEALPTDCRAILSADVLAQLKDTPLNDPAVGATGVQPDGSLVCVWRDPGADTTGIATTISRVGRGPALDALNELREKGATCYTPDGGTRCELSWKNKDYPVTDGHTMFWRAGVMIDTVYSNLAPSGYTASIVSHVFG